jgi:glycosyltransferase involved in cell wall biosynthesis
VKSDVCLIMEGTYPYVAGGVSTWVAQILEHMSHLRFSILYIGARSDAPRVAKYTIPPNVMELREVFIQDFPDPEEQKRPRSVLGARDWRAIAEFQKALARGRVADVAGVSQLMERLPSSAFVIDTLSRSPEAWDVLVEQYETLAPPGTAFLDYFWTHRFINIPTLNLLRERVPAARVYHSACTGYAGLLGAKARFVTGAPLVLTEHGIYTRERRIEIFNAEWIQDSSQDAFLELHRLQSYFKAQWTQFFLALSRTAYHAAEHITTLFDANRRIQERDGAPPARTMIVPNGIDTRAFAAIQPRRRKPGDPFRVGFVGRVSAIKDVKTLLRALGILKRREVAFEAFIMGPTEEEEEYAGECREMTGALGIEEQVKFTGRVNVKEYYGKLDAVVLTSISEGQPFVILEANCAGLPVVATDVGACREMLDGRAPEDRALGPSGLVTPVATPDATADALRRVAESPELCARMGEAGRQRVLRFYDLRDVMNQYLELYESHLYAGRRGPEAS